MVEIFLKSLLLGYSGAIPPGSMLTYTVDKSLRHGVKSGLLISLGHSLLELALVVLIFAGAGKYLGTGIAKTIIGLIGGLVLGYFGVSMLKDVYLNRISLKTETGKNDKNGNMLLGGAVVSISNPYFVIWWSAVGLSMIMSSYNSFGLIGIVVFYIGHILADISWYTFVSAIFSITRGFINIKVYKAVIALLAVCLIGFGLSFFINGIFYILKI